MSISEPRGWGELRIYGGRCALVSVFTLRTIICICNNPFVIASAVLRCQTAASDSEIFEHWISSQLEAKLRIAFV